MPQIVPLLINQTQLSKAASTAVLIKGTPKPLLLTESFCFANMDSFPQLLWNSETLGGLQPLLGCMAMALFTDPTEPQ